MSKEIISTLMQNQGGILNALVTIWNGIKLITQGISYFIFLPLKILNVPITPVFVQMLYFFLLAYILNKFIKNWVYTFLLLSLLSIIGLLWKIYNFL